MKDVIKMKGRIVFDPVDKTNKHKKQASWKRIAMVVIDGDICEYYTWFIQKRYNLKLNRPLRGAHISFINDSLRDIGDNVDRWDALKKKWDGRLIDIVLSVDVRTDSADPGSSGHWWLMIPEEHRTELHSIRAEIGLGRPYYGLHMAIGYANEKYIDHSKYIHRLIKKYSGSYN